ncbi:STM3941 family protein [Pedobacter psychrodurus]|uniref:STM3941 family protein n=1 Tax=Pedobacter psychrodurus TaxID=2530456 RepID=UPI00292EAA10|nr:STM3941 family protein [Pedobacter psychrodurus]
MPEIKLFPSLKKRLILLGLVIALGTLVVALVPFSSASFILYFGLCLAAFCYMLIRLFNRKPVLVLSEAGLLSAMTMNGAKIGLVLWTDISEIRATRVMLVDKGIELHANEAIAEKYQSRLEKKDRVARKTFIMHLSCDEINMKHDELLSLLERYWRFNKKNSELG